MLCCKQTTGDLFPYRVACPGPPRRELRCCELRETPPLDPLDPRSYHGIGLDRCRRRDFLAGSQATMNSSLSPFRLMANLLTLQGSCRTNCQNFHTICAFSLISTINTPSMSANLRVSLATSSLLSKSSFVSFSSSVSVIYTYPPPFGCTSTLFATTYSTTSNTDSSYLSPTSL